MPHSAAKALSAEQQCHRQLRFLRLLLLVLLPLSLLAQFVLWAEFLPGAIAGSADFRHLYIAGYMVRTGHASQLYDYSAQKTFQSQLIPGDMPALPFIRPAYQA